MAKDVDIDALQRRRLLGWQQTPQTRTPDPASATRLIERVGIATLFPASPEVPNLYYAYTGDPTAAVASEWDSDAGHVYGWRWELGRAEAAFYTAIVCGRPTWVRWSLLPAVIRACGELRAPDELVDGGQITPGAYRIVQALEEADGALSTGELRKRAGFPMGKEQRAAYLRAMNELDTRLIVGKVFVSDQEDMHHTLVATRYPEHIAAAENLTREAALDELLAAYLPPAAYAVPGVLARHLKLPEAELRAGLERRVARGLAAPIAVPGQKGGCYVELNPHQAD